MLVLMLLLGTLSFVACGKKKDENQCQGYPSGYVHVTDQRMLQLINTGGGYGNYGSGYNTGYGGYNNGYNNGYNQYNNNQQAICIDQMRYQQLLAQVNGSGQTNCQIYPSAPGCNTSGGSGYGGGGNSNPYCDYYPEDPYCWGNLYY